MTHAVSAQYVPHLKIRINLLLLKLDDWLFNQTRRAVSLLDQTEPQDSVKQHGQFILQKKIKKLIENGGDC